jgi:hypothetical protein
MSRASREDRERFSGDISGRTSNGLIGALAEFAGPAGSLVHGVVDAKQFNDFYENTYGKAPSLGETVKTGLLSAGKHAITSLVAGNAGKVIGGVIGGYPGMAGGLLASKVTGDLLDKVNVHEPGKSPERDIDGPSVASVSQPSLEAPSNPEVAANTNTGYDSTFGNYDSHLASFAYNSNSAFAAWE